ncbi:dynein light chain 1, cytoplasmic isoform X2 [Cricetulus griseus]|uniref:Dynein light chain n=1 Tax=Cricetulus griseus TaxID=10029 RepID=A0A9J7FHW4_CRIGR|nr:dynein light chain 1, cytoplasmic isoform X2 [Cricetulus griseus]ERE85696.1 dynein light chain 1, cytoplasmic-like protein [Cricetulus griseus]
MCDPKAVNKNADISEEMQQDSVECTTQTLEKYNIEMDIAAHIKKEFEKKYNPTWHYIVGRNFGSYVTHDTKHFIYFYLGQVAILLFKSGQKHGLCQTPSDPSKNKDCILNSKYQRLTLQPC